MAPKRLSCDNGVEFCNDIMRELCHNAGVEMINSTPGNPQANGATERVNAVVKDHITAQLLLAPTVRCPDRKSVV